MKNINPKDTQLSKNFWLHEFIVSRDHPELLQEIWDGLTITVICKCYYLANLYLQPIRDFFNVAVTNLSGIRSSRLNIKVKGSDNSLHLFLGFDAAIDFTIRQKQLLWRIFRYIREHFVFGEAIIYLDSKKKPRFIHISLPNPRNNMQILINYRGEFLSWSEWTELK